MTRFAGFGVHLPSVRFSLVALVLVAIIPALGLMLHAGLEQRRIARAQAEQSALRLISVTSANQARVIEGARVLLVAMARLPEVRRHDSVACNVVFADLMRQYPGYANLGAVEPDGDIFCSAVPMTQPVNAADRTWFQRASRTRTFAIGDYQIGRITGKPTLNVAYPVIDAAGQVQAVVFLALDLAWLNHLASEAYLPEGAALTVIDSGGTILARYPDPEKWVGKAVPDVPIVRAMLSGQRIGTAEAEGLDGIRRLYAFAPLGNGSLAGGTYIGVGIPTRVAFAEADRLMTRNLAGLGLIALLALAAAWVGGDFFLLRRVNALVSATKRVSAGDLSARTGLPYGKGEVSELARVFDEMAETLQRRKAEADRPGEALRRYADRLETLHKIDQDILTAQSPEAVAAAALHHIRTFVVYRRAAFILYDFDANEARVLAHAASNWKMEPGTRFPLETLGDTSDMLNALRQGKEYELDIASLSPQLPAVQAAVAEGIRIMHHIPLIAEGQLLGALIFGLSSPDVLTPKDVEITREVADRVAIAIRQAGLRESLQRHAAELGQRVADQTREIRQTKDFLERLITLSPSLIFETDFSDASVTYTSPNVERFLGYSREEVLGAPGFWKEHVHPEDRSEFDTRLAEAVKQKTRQIDEEYRFLHKEGSYRWFHGTLRIEYDQAGQPATIFGYVQDVSARKAAEEALEQARLEADRANQAKSEFLSRMSHELRTPLNAILGFAQLLEMDALSLEQRESVEHILKAGRHLLDLINEVLDIARIEAGRMALSPEPVRIDEAIAEALDLIQPLAAEWNCSCTLSAPQCDGDRYVLADRQRLKQVLLNLLSNAVKYNREGGAVAVACEDAARDRLRIRVKDTGPGIPPEQMPDLFTPFNRLGAERSGVEGTGLGLALSKRLVEAMGGAIGAESTPGEGSTFWIELPLTQSPGRLRDAEVPGDGQPSMAQTEAPAVALTILYIEDNLSNVNLIERVLARRPGVRLLTAMQGQLGLDLAREHHPDLILLDLHLPDMPGDEALRRLQGAAATREIPVVIISADATKGQRERLLGAGARAYLAKPIDVRQLLEILDGMLKEPVG